MNNKVMSNTVLETSITDKKEQSKVNYEWLFQLIASLSWVVSVFVYGIEGAGDWLQLLAASSWTMANIFSYINQKSNK